jgi:hypothetical protein
MTVGTSRDLSLLVSARIPKNSNPKKNPRPDGVRQLPIFHRDYSTQADPGAQKK